MTSPRRVARAHHWAAGLALPHPGSFQEQLLLELQNREKNRDFARLYVVVELLRGGLQLDPQQVTALLDLYEAELHHDTYVPTFIQAKRAEIQARTAAERAKREADAQTAARVAAMSADDEA